MRGSQRKRDKRELEKLMTNVEKQMTSFEAAIDDLKTFKDELLDLDDEITAKHAEINARKNQLDQDFEDHKLRKLKEVAASLNKEVISREDLSENEDRYNKALRELNSLKTDLSSQVEAQVKEQVEQRLNVNKLENDCKNAELAASVKNYEREIANLKEGYDRLLKELESQKNLTASIAGQNRPKEKESEK